MRVETLRNVHVFGQLGGLRSGQGLNAPNPVDRLPLPRPRRRSRVLQVRRLWLVMHCSLLKNLHTPFRRVTHQRPPRRRTPCNPTSIPGPLEPSIRAGAPSLFQKPFELRRITLSRRNIHTHPSIDRVRLRTAHPPSCPSRRSCIPPTPSLRDARLAVPSTLRPKCFHPDLHTPDRHV